MRRTHKIIIAVAFAALAGVAAYQYYYWFMEGTGPQHRASVPVRKETVRLLSPAPTGKLANHVLEVRSDITDRERAELILRELRKEKVINSGVQLRDVALGLEGVLYLNLSKKLAEPYQGAPPEILMVYSLVNSFALSFKDVSKVQLLVEGEPAYTIRGVVYTFLPLEFNREFMED